MDSATCLIGKFVESIGVRPAEDQSFEQDDDEHDPDVGNEVEEHVT